MADPSVRGGHTWVFLHSLDQTTMDTDEHLKSPKSAQAKLPGQIEGTSGEIQLCGSFTPLGWPKGPHRTMCPRRDSAASRSEKDVFPAQMKTFSSLDGPGWFNPHMPESCFPSPLLDDVRNDTGQRELLKHRVPLWTPGAGSGTHDVPGQL